jgi:hypothetical protein
VQLRTPRESFEQNEVSSSHRPRADRAGEARYDSPEASSVSQPASQLRRVRVGEFR